MPRRKRASGDGGRRPKVCRVEHSEETLVISDSDNEEEEECSVGRSSRAVRLRQRECKSQLQEMTEDEMLDLAMKLSAQEASSAAQRRQLEDNDIQKAIAESLNASDGDGSVKASSSSAQPQESISSVISRLRRKLSYAHQTQVHSGKESTVAPADGPERESTSPLPEMPDLSQTTPSPSSSSAPVCGPLELSNDTTPDIEPSIKDSKKDEFPQPVSSSQPSPGFPKDRRFIHQPLVCVEKLSQDLIDASTGSREQPCTQDSNVGAEASPSQEDLSLTKSHVFTQNDLREKTDILEDKHDASDENESLTQIPDEDLPTYQGDKGLSPKNTDLEECSSPSRKTQRSAERCEAENANEDVTVQSKTTDLKQVEDQIAQDENSAADAESTQNTRSWEGFSSFMVVLLTDDDEEEDGSEEVLPPSPVLHGKTALKIVAQTQPCVSSLKHDLVQDTQISQHALQEDSETSNDLKSKSSNSKPLHTGVERGDHCSVSYYWGVPFCPTGQNPDDYTRVIMCQLEVYEKSLKEARRDLLHKAEWSQPVLPASERPFGPRRLKRYRPPQLSEDEEQNEEESEKENKRSEVQEEREEDKTGSQGPAEGGQRETYVVLSSPEAKDEDVRESPFPNQDKTTAATAHLRNDQWHAPDNSQIERAVEDEETQNHDQFDDEQTVCPETQLTDNNTPELMMTSPASPEQDKTRAESEVMEVDEEEGTPVAEEDVMEQESVSADTAPSQTQQMECPMCSKLFCISRIEMHAAFCDGETEDQNQEEQSQVVRRTRSRRDPTEETPYRPEKSPQMEKCFVCKGMFTSQQYQAHVELCLKKTDSNIHQAGGLLSALERTEQRPAVSDEAGPSDVSSRSNRGPANLFGEGGPESEDTDHLSDFQQQESSKNSQRLARKRKYKR